MSAKLQFMKKMKISQPTLLPEVSKSQADIAEFRLRMEHFKEKMCGWLTGTGLQPEMFTITVRDPMVKGGAFDISCIALHHEDRAVRFMPIFLYGQGGCGCVEATVHCGGHVTTLGRLFMRTGSLSDWTLSLPDVTLFPGPLFDEDTFYDLILALFP